VNSRVVKSLRSSKELRLIGEAGKQVLRILVFPFCRLSVVPSFRLSFLSLYILLCGQVLLTALSAGGREGGCGCGEEG